MKQLIKNYSFSTTAKTITLSDFTAVRLDRLQLIVDATTNKILYNFADSTVATATVSTNVVTLSTLQGGETSADALQIVYDAASGDPTYDTPTLANNAAKETGGNLATAATNSGTIATNTTGLSATVGTPGSALPAKGIVAQGSDGTNARAIKTDASGNVNVNVQGTVPVSGSFYQATQPVSASSLPLPSGAATAANQSTEISSLSSIATNTGNIPAKGTATTANSTPVNIASDQTVPVSSTTLATAANQSTANSSLSTIVTNTTGVATAANQSTANSSLATIATNTASNATASNQTNGNQQTKLTDGTNVASIVPGDAGFNGVVVSNGAKTISFSTSTPGAQTIAAATDVRGYAWMEIVYTSVGSGLTLTGQFSPTSGGTYTNVYNFITSTAASPVGSVAGLGATANQIYAAPVQGNFFQLAVSAFTSGTFAGTITLYTLPRSYPYLGQSSGTNIAGGLPIGIQNSGSQMDYVKSAKGQSDGQDGTGVLETSTLLFNGSAHDRWRSNEAVSLMASAARTTTQTSADLYNYNGLSALDVILDVTSAGTGSITLSINGKDPASGKYYLLLSGAAVTTTSTNRYSVSAQIASVANVRAQDAVPRVFQIVVTANNANSMTYSVGYNLTRGV